MCFIKGRLLLENVFLASKLVNGYHRTFNSNQCAIKYDIAKEFDTFKWSFIISVLKKLPFLCSLFIGSSFASPLQLFQFPSMVAWKVTSQVLEELDMALSPPPQPPYFYVIMNNVLPKMLNKAAAKGKFSYHPRCQEVQLTHLSFADDILVFLWQC